MKPIAEIFSQGEEIVTGQITDTNATWLSDKLVELGFRVSRHTAVGDDLDDLIHLLTEIAERADCCICSGGLGPTIDDLTAEAVAKAFSLPLKMDNTALHQIQQYFASRQRVMVSSNEKQALLPEGSVRLDNQWGTAPGFSLLFRRCRFYFVPGVPYEMKQMFEHYIHQELLSHFRLNPEKRVIIRTIGVGESDIQQQLNNIQLPDFVSLGFRTTAEEIEVKLTFQTRLDEAQRQEIIKQVTTPLGELVYAVDEDKQRTTLVDVIEQKMHKKAWTLSVVETITQGMIAVKCSGRNWLQHAEYNAQTPRPLSPDNALQFAQSFIDTLSGQYPTDCCMVQFFLHSKHQQGASIITVIKTPEGVFHQQKQLMGSLSQQQNRAAMAALNLLRLSI